MSFNCEYCGKETTRREYDYNRARRHFCSGECSSSAHSESYRGKTHWATGVEQSNSHKEKRGIYKSGKDCHNYIDGRKIQNGYVMVKDDGKWTQEHRLVVERAIGRKLKKGEVVHHVNGDRTDNRNSNLVLCEKSYHQWLERRMSELYKREHFAHI